MGTETTAKSSIQTEQAAAPELEIAYKAIDKLKLDPKNPRTHSRKHVKQIAKSIGVFGFNVPILIDAQGNVIAGHGRLLACRELGWSKVPTIALEHLTPTQAKAYMIADNRLTENSEWDNQILAQSLSDLSELDLNFDLDVIGFDMAEIDLRIESLASSAAAPHEEDQIPALKNGVVSRPGELWTLGRHRLYCGSALDEGSYRTVLGDEQAALVFSDPPYNVPIDGHASGLGAVKHQDFAMAAGEMTEEQFIRFLRDACSLFAKYSRSGSIHYLCMDWRHLDQLLAAGKAVYSELKNICVWVKHNAGMGSLYRSQHELVLVFKNGHEAHRNNVALGTYGRSRTNVWNYAGVNYFGRAGEEGKLLDLHPTVKPVPLIADAIIDCSARNDIVLDGFLGSGSTLIAAERTGRRCYGIELEAGYVDTAIRRWQNYTGERAVSEVDGLTFNQREAGLVSK